MTKNKKLEVGDEVLIFTKVWDNIYDYVPMDIVLPFKKGIITEIYYDYNGYVSTIYVLGDDKRKYFGGKGVKKDGNALFLTKEDYVEFLRYSLSKNKAKIRKIERHNNKIRNYMSVVNGNK